MSHGQSPTSTPNSYHLTDDSIDADRDRRCSFLHRGIAGADIGVVIYGDASHKLYRQAVAGLKLQKGFKQAPDRAVGDEAYRLTLPKGGILLVRRSSLMLNINAIGSLKQRIVLARKLISA